MGEKKNKRNILRRIKKLFKSKPWMWLVFGFAIIFLFFSIISFGIYILGWNNLPVRLSSKVIPFPIVFINGNSAVTYDEYLDDVDKIRRYHEMQDVIWDFENYNLASEEGVRYLNVAKKNTLQRLIEKKIISLLNQKYQISPSDKEYLAELNKIIEANGGMESLKNRINKIYKMDIKYFKENVIIPQVNRNNLRQHLIDKKIIESEDQFSEWIKNEMKNYNIIIPLSQYYWSDEETSIYFSQNEMNNYEAEVLKK